VSTEPNKNWVFLLSLVILAGFVAFIGFVALYYVLAVVARNRRYATQAINVAHVPAGATAAVAAPAAAPAAPAAAPAAPAQAPAAAPAATPAAPKAAPAAAPSTGGVPRIDPNNLPDGIDAVTRGRLKKLAVLQERGQEPPAELLDELKGVLAGMGGAPAAQAPAGQAPAEAVAEQPTVTTPDAPEAEAPAPEPVAAPAPEPVAAPASTGGLPHIDVNNLPDGIDAVARGRLKKLAILQERGQEPPADLVESLKPILDQIGG
jgi:2-oxoglutarate dehydrogenase E2 component (dihydrolipoamide succinyltransferase)